MRIDFQELKATVSIEQIIAWLSIDLKKTGVHQLRGNCPIHNGSNDRQFVVSTDKNLWHCFGDCNSGGDIIELVARLQKISQKQAAEMIAAHFGKASVAAATIKKLEPIDYLDPDHAALHALGITKETCMHFSIAEELGMGVASINRFVKELEDCGLIEIERRGQGKTNVYNIAFVVQKKRKS